MGLCKAHITISPGLMSLSRYTITKKDPLEVVMDEEHKMLCIIYLVIMRMIKSGIVMIHTDYVLKWIPETISQEKREMILENARSRSIAYAIWAGYKPPFTLNSLFCHIIPRLTITKEMVFDAIEMFSQFQ